MFHGVVVGLHKCRPIGPAGGYIHIIEYLTFRLIALASLGLALIRDEFFIINLNFLKKLTIFAVKWGT